MSSYKHLMVPTDFSTYSENALKRAQALAGVFGAGISILHVVDYFPPGYLSSELPPEFSSEEALVGRATAELADWVERVGVGSAEQVVVVGPPKSEIVRIAKERGVDLIVIGSSGMSGFKRLLGSTTNGVLHDAPCDVLSVQAVVEG
jgi:universal stress protein A